MSYRVNSYSSHEDRAWLKIASAYAKEFSGCTKVSVGSAIMRDGTLLAIGANRTIPDLCRTARGCLRVEKYGENSKDHRLPADCRAIHSEVDALCAAASAGVSVSGASIYVTRYPCEACARAIIAAGISVVVYGREQKISAETEAMFERTSIEVYHLDTYKEDDTTI